ncbi:MAG: efflux RND transporter periplasmic adaptor subunit [Bacteroidales bacterium]|nr:efflux RND transporter periplasmic adaptor subunit [Bacteroidales bacterium]
MKKNWKRNTGIGLFVLVIILLIANRLGYFSKADTPSVLVNGLSNNILPVKATILKARPLTDKLVAAGSVKADEQVDISAEASGKITQIHFREGTLVKKGDLLVTINNADLLAQLERNKSLLALAEQREARQRSLLDKQGISQQAYDQVFTELSTVKSEKAILQAQLDKTLVRAPFDGLLGLRQVSEGAYATPGMKIVRLAKIEPVKIDFSLPERYAGYLSKGSQVRFSVENSPEEFVAEIYAIEAVVDQQTRSLPVRAMYANSAGKVLPGSFARVEIALTSTDNALQIPTEALIPEMGGSKVFVYRNGFAQPLKVSAGLRTNASIQITEGLMEGDTVITTGILQMKPGLPVTISLIN